MKQLRSDLCEEGIALLLCIAMMVMLTYTVAAKTGAPSSAHSNLNLISVQHEKDMVDSSGGTVIFVLQDSDTEITMRKTNLS
ncbi:MAG: hypothetical protein JEZ08_07575 [Clostridiales bacterium]|nr:hypothetical protein [Clostridiales bacterium]